jgi:hypothetical protein
MHRGHNHSERMQLHTWGIVGTGVLSVRCMLLAVALTALQLMSTQ